VSDPLVVPVRVLPHGEGLPLPARATADAAGFDLRAAVEVAVEIAPGRRALIPCGVALAIPRGWEGQVRPRSGLALRHGITLINSPGTIDADYRGELLVPLVNLGESPFTVQRGERIAQILFARVPEVRLEVVAELPEDSARGVSGFGSTGRG
jgi:dUTP pyrophosphatase